jgi:Fic family protein
VLGFKGWAQDAQGDPVYEAPDRSFVEDLMAEAIVQANSDVGPPLVRAAMAHLNVAMIHPFSDGNGRMARCLQTLVLASGGLTAPEFSSIEEYLGRNTQAYSAALTEVGQGQWSPSRSTKPWIRFCLTAHYRQAHTVLRRVQETEALWDCCEQLVDERRLPRRAVPALCDAARGYRLRRSMYVKLVNSSLGEEITAATATRELRALAEGGLFQSVGEKRGRSYLPTPELREMWSSIRARRGPRGEEDPYEISGHPTLPGSD